MKTKKFTKIIFEKQEITRIWIGRRETEIEFDEAAEDEKPDEPLLIKNPDGFKSRLRKKMREIWKRRRRLR